MRWGDLLVSMESCNESTVKNLLATGRRVTVRPASSFCLGAILLAALCLAGLPAPGRAQFEEYEKALEARAKVFPGVGTGVRAIKRDGAGRYYILTAPGLAVSIYDADGRPLGKTPENVTKESGILYGEDLDVDPGGQVYVADRGANAVKVFDPKGQLAMTIPVPSPTSVILLPGGEIAVSSMRTPRLVEVFDSRGKIVREFGDVTELAEHADLNRFLNMGNLETDAAGHIYYSFSYFPEPTLRKYDRFGFAAFDVALTSLDLQRQAAAVRREISEQDEKKAAPNFKRVINAVGVDPQTQVVFVAIGDQLLQLDREGNRKVTYRTFTKSGERVEPVSILVEPDRLLLATDSLGIYDFARPDKPKPAPAPPQATPEK